MPDVVVLSARTPTRASAAGLRTCAIVEALAHLADVAVHYVPSGRRGPDPGLEADARVSLHEVEPITGLGGGLPRGVALARGVPGDLAEQVHGVLARVARTLPPDARIVADGPEAAAALLGLLKRRRVGYLAHRLEARLRHHVPGSPQAKAVERFERRVLQGVEVSWLPTEADLAAARALAGPHAALVRVPDVVDVQAIDPVGLPPGRDRLLLVGDFSDAADAAARAWLVDEVMPLVWGRRPSTTLVLAGPEGDGRGLPPDRVEVLGPVEDLAEAYRSADAVAVPQVHGSATALRFVEALAHGVPVVATGQAAALLEEGVPGRHFAAADEPGAFAAAVVKALDGRAAEHGVAGRALAARAYSIDALVELLR